jgi:hypothetical protein
LEQKSLSPAINALLLVINIPQASQRTICAALRARAFFLGREGVNSQRINRITM